MKIVFVNLVDDLYELYSNYVINQPPLSLGVLANLTSGFEVEILDEQIDELKFEGDVFAFSVCTQLAKKSYEYADKLRKEGKIVIMGGYHATVRPDECIEHADCVVVGEAEHVWHEVLEDLKNGKLKKKYIGEKDKELKIPVIKRDIFKNKKYIVPNTIFVSRGCNFNCDFCVSSKVYGKYRLRPLEDVEKELDGLRLKGWKSMVMLIDDNPFADKSYTEKLLESLRKRKVNWVTQVTMNDLYDKEFMKKIADAGCVSVGVGVESLFKGNNKSINKTQNLDVDVKEAVEYVNSLGITVVAFLIFGLEHDTIESLKQGVSELKKIPFSHYDICLLRVLPGSALYERMLKEKKVTEDWWLKEETAYNKILPGYLRMYYKHGINDKELQDLAIRSIIELNSIASLSFAKIFFNGMIKGNVKFAFRHLIARAVMWNQARKLKSRVLRMSS